MKFMPERRLLCELGKRLWEKGFTPANDGNLSMRAGPDRILITPAGVSKSLLSPDMIVLVDGQGEPLDDGSPWSASSEINLHLMCYNARPGIGAVCHAHPPAATAYAAVGKALPHELLDEARTLLGPVPCASYAPAGSEELARAAQPHILAGKAVLLANHGALTVGKDLHEAWATMERLEHTALVGLYAGLLGGRKA